MNDFFFELKRRSDPSFSELLLRIGFNRGKGAGLSKQPVNPIGFFVELKRGDAYKVAVE
mgnify:CR=1 FL=1